MIRRICSARTLEMQTIATCMVIVVAALWARSRIAFDGALVHRAGWRSFHVWSASGTLAVTIGPVSSQTLCMRRSYTGRSAAEISDILDYRPYIPAKIRTLPGDT
jgi:hypothetical protein